VSDPQFPQLIAQVAVAVQIGAETLVGSDGKRGAR